MNLFYVSNIGKAILLRVSLLCLLFIYSGSLWAQEPSGPSFTFDHVALSVADVDQSASFYQQVFGLNEITNRTKFEGIRWFSLGEAKELHLISLVKGSVKINRAVHFALNTPNFDGFVRTLESRDLQYSNIGGAVGEVTIRADGVRQLYVQDPDGYWIEVNSVVHH